MAYLQYNPKWLRYYGLSSYDTPTGLQVGDKAYFFDTEKNVVWDGTTWVDDMVNTDAVLETGDLQIGAVEIKNANDDTRAEVGANGLYVDIRNIESTMIDHISGTATDGTQTTLVDTNKSYPINVNIGKSIVINIGDTEYIRTITSNTSTTQTFTPSLPGAAASAVIGEVSAGQVTVVSDTQGVGGNEYSIELVAGVGNNIPLSATLNGLVITVTLATDGIGDLDDAENTATAVASVIDVLDGFSATMTGAGGAMSPTVSPIQFTGGIAVVSPTNGIAYKIIDKINNALDVVFHDESTSINAGDEFTVGSYKNLTIEIYGTSATRTVNFKAKSKSGNPVDIQGVNISTLATGVTTTGQGEVWTFDIAGLDAVFFGLAAVSGGYVSIKGRATV